MMVTSIPVTSIVKAAEWPPLTLGSLTDRSPTPSMDPRCVTHISHVGALYLTASGLGVWREALLGLAPRPPWEPARHAAPIRDVFVTEALRQGRLFVADDEQRHDERDGAQVQQQRHREEHQGLTGDDEEHG